MDAATDIDLESESEGGDGERAVAGAARGRSLGPRPRPITQQLNNSAGTTGVNEHDDFDLRKPLSKRGQGTKRAAEDDEYDEFCDQTKSKKRATNTSNKRRSPSPGAKQVADGNDNS